VRQHHREPLTDHLLREGHHVIGDPRDLGDHHDAGAAALAVRRVGDAARGVLTEDPAVENAHAPSIRLPAVGLLY